MKLGLAILTIGTLSGCTPTEERLLPGATHTPHLETQESAIACGDDISFYGNAGVDLRYTFSYDGAGRILRADGVWTDDGSTETTDYAWDGDNLTNILATSSWDGSQAEVVASYDAANNLVDYTWSYASTDYNDSWSYAFSEFVGANPTREVISQQGEVAATYELVYDGAERLIEAIQEGGPSTTWTYDDAGGTITVDTDGGAFVGVGVFDDESRLLSETWTGSDPSMIDSDDTYLWTGDRLDSIRYRSGSEAAPHELELVEVDTLRYNCAAARTHVGRTAKGPRRRR